MSAASTPGPLVPFLERVAGVISATRGGPAMSAPAPMEIASALLDAELLRVPAVPGVEPGSDLEQLTAICDSLDGALAELDAADPPVAPVSALALIAVAVLRGILPMLHAERDRMLAAAATKVAGGKA